MQAGKPAPQQGGTASFGRLHGMDVRQIEYAPIQPNLRRKRVIRWFIRVAVVLVLLPVGIKGVPMAWHRAQLLYWQRKAMNYAAPASQLVFETGSGTSTVP